MLAEVETEIVETALKMSPEFKKLYNEHQTLGKKLAKMNKSLHLSPTLESEKKKLQKIKLAGKDRMIQIANDFSSVSN